jgi:two-component system chemotaxis response regulator CheY
LHRRGQGGKNRERSEGSGAEASVSRLRAPDRLWRERTGNAERAAGATEEEVHRGRGMLRKILAVDDSALIHQMYKLFLSRYKNCKLISAMNGLEALDKLGQEDGIDLILLDINMPVMNGLEFLQRVQKEPAYQGIPIIIISTEGKEEDTIRGLKMGAKGYVKKPFQASELHGLIEKITTPPG